MNDDFTRRVFDHAMRRHRKALVNHPVPGTWRDRGSEEVDTATELPNADTRRNAHGLCSDLGNRPSRRADRLRLSQPTGCYRI